LFDLDGTPPGKDRLGNYTVRSELNLPIPVQGNQPFAHSLEKPSTTNIGAVHRVDAQSKPELVASKSDGNRADFVYSCQEVNAEAGNAILRDLCFSYPFRTTRCTLGRPDSRSCCTRRIYQRRRMPAITGILLRTESTNPINIQIQLNVQFTHIAEIPVFAPRIRIFGGFSLLFF